MDENCRTLLGGLHLDAEQCVKQVARLLGGKSSCPPLKVVERKIIPCIQDSCFPSAPYFALVLLLLLQQVDSSCPAQFG